MHFPVGLNAHLVGRIFPCPLCGTETISIRDDDRDTWLQAAHSQVNYLERGLQQLANQSTDNDQRIVLQFGNKHFGKPVSNFWSSVSWP